MLRDFDPGPEIRRSVRGQQRHRPRLRAAARELLRCARSGDERRLAVRLASLRRALWGSPFYCHTLRARGLSPEDLRGIPDLRHFPLLDRETLRAGFAALPALDAASAGPLRVDRSSGSTGQPLTVLKDDYDVVHMWAALRFWLRWLGVRLPPRPRVALLCALPHGVEYRTPLPAFGDGSLLRVSLARPDPMERLQAFSPHVLFSDPAGLHWLAGRPRPPRPRLVLSSAFHLSPHLRSRVERALGAPVLDYYSCSETGPIAWGCRLRPGRFHVLLPDVWLESVEGELVVTRLRPSVLPLLRYRTGDRGEVQRDACACGYRGTSVTGFSGRSACSFVTRGGRTVDAWALAWVFQHQPLDGFRLTQTALDAFVLELRGDAGGALLPRLRAALAALGFEGAGLTLVRAGRQALASGKPLSFARELAV